MMPNNNENGIRMLNEAYEDGLFRLVMNKVAQKEGEMLLEENERLKNDPENLPSQESIKNFTILLDKHLRKTKPQKSHRRSKILGRSVVALVALLIFFFTMIVSVQAVRIRVLNFLISIEPKYTTLQLNESDDTRSDGKLLVNWTNAYVPTYIPSGYKVINVSYSDSIKMVKFTNSSNNSTIVYTEYDSTDRIAVDTEGASLIKTIKINGHDGTLSVKDSTTSVGWVIDNDLFTIQGQISADEAIKMAEGVKFVK